MTPRQIIAEILRDYKWNLEGGMPQEQSLEVLRAMLIDLIEYEKEKAFAIGEKSGRFAVMSERQFSLGSYKHNGTAGDWKAQSADQAGATDL